MSSTRRTFLLSLAIAAFALCVSLPTALLISGCGYAKRKDPPVYTYPLARLAEESARLHARDVGGSYHQNQCCGSMEPLIHAGDYVVVKPEPFTDDLLGRPVVYIPAWGGNSLVEHRLTSGNAKDGFIASGDSVPTKLDEQGRDRNSENQYRVREGNYLGTIVGVYKVKP